MKIIIRINRQINNHLLIIYFNQSSKSFLTVSNSNNNHFFCIVMINVGIRRTTSYGLYAKDISYHILGHFSWGKFELKKQNCQFKLKFCTYNLGHNILELYNVLVQIRLTTSKTKRDTLIGSTFAGLTFADCSNRKILRIFTAFSPLGGPMCPHKEKNSKDFAGIYFRCQDFSKNFAIFVDQILVMFVFQNGTVKG